MKELRSAGTIATVLSLLLGVACGSSDSNTVTPDGGNPPDAGNTPDANNNNTDAGSDAQASGPLGFTPSNFDLSGLDLTKVGDVVLSGSNCFIQPAVENPGWSCAPDTTKFVSKTITRADQSKMVVYVVKSLRIEPSTILLSGGGLAGGGGLPFAIVALEKMTLLGSIKVDPGFAGGFSNALGEAKGAGPGGGGSGPGTQKAAGGGASFCGIGGQGSAQTGATAYPKSSAYGTAELVPLVGGSAGGSGAIASGSGGGALQLVAGTSIELGAGTFVSAPGAGGNQGGLAASQQGSGGGSGGAILIESPTVKIAGTLATNGGGGGEGAGGDALGGANGEVGHDSDALPAKGGAAGTNNHGGNGGAGDTADATDGLSNVGASASGGGGGVGRIRINTTTGQADITSATLSPSAKTSCFTQGTLKK